MVQEQSSLDHYSSRVHGHKNQIVVHHSTTNSNVATDEYQNAGELLENIT